MIETSTFLSPQFGHLRFVATSRSASAVRSCIFTSGMKEIFILLPGFQPLETIERALVEIRVSEGNRYGHIEVEYALERTHGI